MNSRSAIQRDALQDPPGLVKPSGYGQEENQETISQSDTRRSHQGNGEAESRYVCERVEFRLFGTKF